MKLTIDRIREVATGAVNVAYEDGRYHFFRFSHREAEVIDNINVLYTAGIQMKFKTDGKQLKLKVHTERASDITSYFCFDIFVNGALAGCIQNLNDDARKGSYARLEYPLGSYYKDFQLGSGEKDVKIVFPHSVNAQIEEIELVDASYIVPVKNEKTIVFYGDSITQGYDSLHPSKSYAARLADALDAEVINKALGGAVFGPELAEIPNDIAPDWIVVAYGTNDWNSVDLDCFRENAKGFFHAIQKNYPGIPKYVITPTWRCDWQTTKRCGEFSVLEDTINEIFGNRENITVISGFDLVPHDENLFGDLWLHPNDEGFAYYFSNLMKFFK